jgi:hypothetical protein
VIKLGDPLGLAGPDRNMVDLPRLLPAVVFIAFLNLRMLLPGNIELRLVTSILGYFSLSRSRMEPTSSTSKPK